MEMLTKEKKPTWYTNLLSDILDGMRKLMHPDDENEEDYKSFYIVKDAEGNYRWFGWVTNKWEDLEKDIFTDSAHREFNQFLDEHPELAPELWTWHEPLTARKHKADWWDYANGFFTYSGPLTEDEALALEETDEPVAMSHGCFVLQREGPYILKYRTFEVSELPLSNAANPFTDFTTLKERDMFTNKKRAWLVQRFGEDKVAELETGTEQRAKTLEDLGVSWKEINEQYEQEIEKEFAGKVAEASKQTVATIVKQVVAALNIPQLQETLAKLHEGVEANAGLADRVTVLEEQVNHLLDTDDERIAEAIAPTEPFDWSLSAVHNAKPVKNEDLEEDVKKEVQQMSGELDWMNNLNPFQEVK